MSNGEICFSKLVVNYDNKFVEIRVGGRKNCWGRGKEPVVVKEEKRVY